MSGKASFLEDLALRLSRFPGLGFLHSYTVMIRQRKTNFDQQVGDYQGMVDNARGIGRDVKGGKGRRSGKKKRPNSDTL